MSLNIVVHYDMKSDMKLNMALFVSTSFIISLFVQFSTDGNTFNKNTLKIVID